MSRTRLTLGTTLVTALLFASALSALAGETIVLDLRRDPIDGGRVPTSMFVEGPEAFVFDPAVPAAHHGDRPGALIASYDSTQATSRAVLPLERSYTEADDFLFGAVLTVRGEGFEPDPFGFHPITFSLINDATTGFDRTGDLLDFRADAFDALEFAWFPQVSPLFGGPFLAPGAFGSAVGDDAFANFAFASVPFDLGTDVPRLVTVEHDASARILTVTVHDLSERGEPVPIPGGSVEVDLSGLTGFDVNALAVTAYEDGFNVFSSSGRSLRADVEYHRLFFAGELVSSPELLRAILSRGGPRWIGRPLGTAAPASARSGGEVDLDEKPRLGLRDASAGGL